MPLQQLLEIVAKFDPTDLASEAAAKISKFRADLGVNVTTDESGEPLETPNRLNPKLAEQQALEQTITRNQNQNVAIDINDRTGNANVSSSNNAIPVNVQRTVGLNFGG